MARPFGRLQGLMCSSPGQGRRSKHREVLPPGCLDALAPADPYRRVRPQTGTVSSFARAVGDTTSRVPGRGFLGEAMTDEVSTQRNGGEFAVTFVLFIILSFIGGGLIHQEPFRTFWPVAAGAISAAAGFGWRRLRAKRNKR